MGGIYEEVKTSGGLVQETRTYYPAAGAMRVGSTLYYVLKDHLGSASVLTDAAGAPVANADVRYLPFGEARFSTTPMLTDKLFTGQREITGLGIYHYGARFYSPKLGRFLSPDTIVPGYANPQNLNRYSYVRNNPLRYTDPTGHRVCEEYQGTCLSEDQMTDVWNETNGNNNDDDDEPGNGDFCDPVLGCENPDTGIFCDQISCWYDVATDVAGTAYDPAVYISGSIACAATGCLSAIGGLSNITGWEVLKLCAHSKACWKYVGFHLAAILPLKATQNNSSQMIVLGNMPGNIQKAKELGAIYYSVQPSSAYTLEGNVVWLLDRIQKGYNIVYSNYPPRPGSVFEIETIIQNLFR